MIIDLEWNYFGILSEVLFGGVRSVCGLSEVWFMRVDFVSIKKKNTT